MGREGHHNNNTRARKGAKIPLPKLSRMNVWNGRHAGLRLAAGAAAWGQHWNLFGSLELSTPSLA